MGLVEDNSALIELREKEIQSIVQSISELNDIFRDLATMIVEQVGFQNQHCKLDSMSFFINISTRLC
jgi:hypothetical protein